MTAATALADLMPDAIPDHKARPNAADFERTPEQALEAAASQPGLLLVDLDETLFLHNSTELFLECARPGILALLILRLLDGLRPWRYTGGIDTRDNWRVGVIALLFPWTWLVWRQRACRYAADHVNMPLRDALLRRSVAPVIVTAGFLPIVRTLCRAMELGDTRIIGCRLFALDDRRGGKLLLAKRTLGMQSICDATVITDSPSDLPVLHACSNRMLVRWPQARFVPAFDRMYMPGQYIARVKHVGQRYILRGILQEDFAFWVLASIGLAAAPAWHCTGLLLLLVSFWAIYERGYVDNDATGARHESDPKLSPEFHTSPVATPLLAPWIWATASGILGVLALWHPASPPPDAYLRWAVVLVAAHAWFWIYNRVDKGTRVWLYSGLQVGRTAAFVALVPVSEIGVAALAAHVFARWTPYYFYRHGSNRWLTEQFHLTRLMMFLWLAVMLGLATGLDSVANGTGAMLLAWNLFRARHELRAAARHAHRIDREQP